jgi:uncharacterized protein (DUF58 family)
MDAAENVPASATTGPDEVLRRLDLMISHKLAGMLHGEYQGLVPGHGSDLGETRSYQAGDDVRRIDWNVTARMQAPHVRDPIADRELETWIAIDLSPSMDFGTAWCEKRDLAVSAAAAVGFLTARTGNRVGAVLITPEGPVTIPARGGRAHLLAILHRIVTAPRIEHVATDLGAGLDRLAATSRRRGLAVVISDFLTEPPAWERPLQRVAARHDTIAVEVLDRRELELPDMGMLSLVDPTTGNQQDLPTASRKLRSRYAAAAAEQRRAIAGAIAHSGADRLQLRTDRDWLLDVVRFVTVRRERISGRSRPPVLR